MVAAGPLVVGAPVTGSGASAAVPIPAGAAGDLVVVSLFKRNNAAVSGAPSGATALPPQAPSSDTCHYVFAARATDGNAGTWTLTWSGSTVREAVAVRMPGAAAAFFDTGDGAPVSAGRASSAAGTPPVELSTQGPDRLLLWIGANYTGGAWTPPDGFTEAYDNASKLTVATATQSTAGDTGPVVGTCATSEYETAFLLAVVPAVVAPTQTINPGTVPGTDPQPAPQLAASIRLGTVPAPAAPPNPQVIPGTVYIFPTPVPPPAPPPAPKLVQIIRAGTVAPPPAPEPPEVIAYPRPPLRIDFWALDDDGTILCPLPQPAGFDLSLIPGAPGAVKIQYPRDGLHYDVLDQRVTRNRDLHIKIRVDGTDTHALGALLSARDGDEVSEGDTVTFTGAFMTVRLREARIRYNPNDPAKKGNTSFVAATGGAIMAWFLQAAQARSVLTDLWWTFTDTHDSNGVPWPSNAKVTAAFSPGKTLLDVAQQLRKWGLVEFEVTTDREVRLYLPQTVGTDHTLSDPPLVLRRGRDLVEAPRRSDTSASVTDLEVAGAQGVYVDVFDATARARRGRRIEGYASEGNLTDVGSATTYAQIALSDTTTGVEELDYTLTFAQDLPAPIRDIAPSDWLYADTGAGLTSRERVAQLTVSQKPGKDQLTGGVVLRDLLAERDIVLKRQLDALTSGSAVVGTSTGDTGDTVAPAAPIGVVVDSKAYAQGADTLATLIVEWARVTTNVDGTAATDIAGYRVEWQLASNVTEAWALGADTTSTAASFGDVAAGAEVWVRVCCYDRDGNVSPWSDTVAITTANDTTGPPVLSAPTVSNYLGVLLVGWDGKGAAGEDMPADFDYANVYQSAANSFESATVVDRLYGAGTLPVADVPYGVTQYFWLVGVDRTLPTPNESDGPSAPGSGAPEKVVGDDVFAGAVGSEQLADLAVKTAKIDNGAVNDLQVGSASVGKLTGGIFSSALTLAGIFKTGDTGARGEWDATSFRQFNAAGVQTVGLTPGGISFITGEFRTALTGQRIVMNPGGNLADTIRVYPSGSGSYGQIMARTAPADGTAAILLDGGTVPGSTAARGRVGAYKAEAFVSYVVGDDSGDGSGGYSATAVSCGSGGRINMWCQDQLYLQKKSGNNGLDGSLLGIFWAAGTTTDYDPCISANNAGVKFDSNMLLVTGGTGAAFGPIKATAFNVASGADAKTDITDLRHVLTPLDVIRAARSKAWKYVADVAQNGDAAPLRFGPLADDLPQDLVVQAPAADGSGLEPSVSLGDQVGTLWGAFGQIIDQQIVSTSAVAIVPVGTRLTAGATIEVPVTWESTAPAAPTGGFATINSGLAWAGKATAWIKTGTVTAQGCVVIFKNIGSGQIIVTSVAATAVSAAVVGLGLYSPPYTAADGSTP